MSGIEQVNKELLFTVSHKKDIEKKLMKLPNNTLKKG